MKRLLLPCLLIFTFLFGCATTKKSPCKPFRKTINCFQFGDWECNGKLNQFIKDLLEGFEQTRKTSDHLTVITENGEVYNLKVRLDVDIPTMYIDATHCIQGEVADKERKYINLEYR